MFRTVDLHFHVIMNCFRHETGIQLSQSCFTASLRGEGGRGGGGGGGKKNKKSKN